MSVDDTLDDELVDCPACAGTGKHVGDDFVRGNGCLYCHGLRRIQRSRAVALEDAMTTTVDRDDFTPTGPTVLFDLKAAAERSRGYPRGIGMWIAWNANTTKAVDNAVIVENAKAAGLGWLAVKSGESSESTQWLRRAKDLIARCRDEGLGLFSWHYSYPETWQQQVSHIARVIESGVDGHIIDAETEWEYAPGTPHFSSVRHEDTAAQFMASLREHVGASTFIAHAPIWRPQSHVNFPWAQFGERCDAVMPQAYWPAAAQSARSFCARLDDAWRGFLATHPTAAKAIWPIAATYGAGDGWDNFPGRLTEEDLGDFVDHYHDLPVSLFSWDAANAATWLFLNRLAASHGGTPQDVA